MSENLKTFRDLLFKRLEIEQKRNPKKSFTEEDIGRIAQAYVLPCMSTFLGSEVSLTNEEYELGLRIIGACFDLKQELGSCIEEPYQPWYFSRKAEIDFFYWNRFLTYLKEEKKEQYVNINSKEEGFLDPLAAISSESDQILDRLGDPLAEEFDKKGLILGDVQSGKTVNFTALINKAADAGYKLFFVLTGTIEVLRKQTQGRLEREFIGFSTEITKNHEFIGVSKYSSDVNKNTEMNPRVLTTRDSDFTKSVLTGTTETLDGKRPLVFILKKNVPVLSSLLKWLKRPQNKTLAKETPTLILDDEADYAGVNVAKPENDPTKINSLIRKVLTYFNKKSYIAVTATPFANIFINPHTDDAMLKDDLFPRDFIYALNPPSSYVGIERIFGEEADRSDIVQYIDDLEEVLKNGHKSDADFNQVPESLKQAILYFLLLNAIADKGFSVLTHRSMLIHISHFRKCHTKITRTVKNYFQKVQDEIANYAALDPDEAVKHSYIAQLKDVWDSMELEAETGYAWEDILKNYLYRATAPIQVVTVNSNPNSKALNYEAYEPQGLRVIVIGGNSLSRGLTLEGLIVSYFRRTTKMYDTLMQMGRWFGFNLDKMPYAKVWMPQLVESEFVNIAESYRELKRDIVEMQLDRLPPKEFGLRIRRSSKALLPTARNKMRTAKVLRRNVSLLGSFIATPRLPRISLAENEKCIREFIAKLNKEGVRDSTVKVHPYWRGVSREVIAKLVANFKSDHWNLNYRAGPIADYIQCKYTLDDWDVVIHSLSGDGEVVTFETLDGEVIKVKAVVREVLLENDTLLVSKSHLQVATGGSDGAIGLNDEQKNFVKKRFEERNKQLVALGKKPIKNINNKDYFVAGVNRKPVLHIYPIRIKGGEDLNGSICYAIGLGFPNNGNVIEKTVEYYVNLVEWEQYNNAISDDYVDARDI